MNNEKKRSKNWMESLETVKKIRTLNSQNHERVQQCFLETIEKIDRELIILREKVFTMLDLFEKSRQTLVKRDEKDGYDNKNSIYNSRDTINDSIMDNVLFINDIVLPNLQEIYDTKSEKQLNRSSEMNDKLYYYIDDQFSKLRNHICSQKNEYLDIMMSKFKDEKSIAYVETTYGAYLEQVDALISDIKRNVAYISHQVTMDVISKLKAFTILYFNFDDEDVVDIIGAANTIIKNDQTWKPKKYETRSQYLDIVPESLKNLVKDARIDPRNVAYHYHNLVTNKKM